MTAATPGDSQDNPKIAVLGNNVGNISDNAPGGRFFFELLVTPNEVYDFSLTGDEGTKFDLYLFDYSYLPSIIVEDSEEFVDTNSYPVDLELFSTPNEKVLIQVYSNPTDGGTGNFTLSISLSDSSTTSEKDQSGSDSDTNNTPGIKLISSMTSLFIVRLAVSMRDDKNTY
jgi:hypothetical protein